MSIFRSILLVLLGYLAAAPVMAKTVTDLYTATIPVQNYDKSSRMQAMRQALNLVLIKVSGNVHVNTLNDVQNQQPDLDHMLNQYSYTETKDFNKPLLLKVSFDPDSVQSLLKKAGQAIWSEDRPLSLVWLAYADKTNMVEEPNLVTNDNEHPFVASINEAASDRGLPAVLPILDLETLKTVNAQTIWQFDIPTLQNVSRQYQPDSILMIRLEKLAEDSFQVDVLQVINQEHIHWRAKNAAPTRLLNKVVNRAADNLANQFSQLSANMTIQNYILIIDGIKTLQDYSKVNHYLDKHSSIKHVLVLDIHQDTVVFDIQLKANREAFTQQLALDKHLKPRRVPNPGPTELNYHLVG